MVSHAGVTLSVPARSRGAAEGSPEITIAHQQWAPAKTALILCDFWDSHHCANAVKRVNELAPRVAAVVRQAREMGVLIIHSPSDCMESYAEHPARQRAIGAPAAPDLPQGIGAWMHWKSPEEEKAGYPIDASDGGSDDTPEEAAAWKAELVKQGRHPGHPWRGQHPAVSIDAERDIISDKGAEIWNVLQARGIKDILLAGVHTNMCVCGRPFGLRQLSKHGKNVVLLRDLTDTMYNPAMRPQVPHTAGTELIVAHIERYIAPTVLSTEVFGGVTPLFTQEKRRHLAVMIGEDEYRTAATLPVFMDGMVKDFRVSYILPAKEQPSEFFNMAALDTADVLLVSVRRRLLPEAQLAAVRKFAARGGAIAGIRTASHAFAPRKDQAMPAGSAAWTDWDETILGGNYQNHLGNDLKTFARIAAGVGHPILAGIPAAEWPTGGSLYRNTPLRGGSVLLTGRAEGAAQEEPVAWTHATPAKGRVFYTSLGHPDDFQRNEFQTLLRNALRWCAGLDSPATK